MTQYLVDTNVVSTFAPVRPVKFRPTDEATEWFARHSRDLFMSAMTVMEIESGVQQLAKRGSHRKSRDLSVWFSTILAAYQERILAFDRTIAIVAGRIEADSTTKGRHPGLPDIVIAATATTHRLTLLTQNMRRFVPFGIACVNPFENLPHEG